MKCIIIFTILLRLCFLLVGVRADPRNTLVVDKQGRVYFGDVLHNTVWKIQDGKLTPFLKDKHSHRVVLDEQGNLCLRDGSGTVRVKLGATPTGAGLILFD